MEGMSDRVLFLDIDGVILPTRMWAAPQNIGFLDVHPDIRAPQLTFDPGAIGLLMQIARLSGARFVLHSNWRRGWVGRESELQDLLVRSGLERERWHGRWAAPAFESMDKGEEISAWLGTHGDGLRECLIVDDEPIETLTLRRPVRVAQLRPMLDDGLGMREYRSALGFFGILDGRLRSDSAAPLWPVRVRPG